MTGTVVEPRTYLFTLADGGGTVPPELGAVRRLVERGHHVTVLAEDSMADDVERTGAVSRRWARGLNRATRRPEDDPYRDWECRTPMALFDRILDRQFVGPAAGYAADTLDAIAHRRPDLVVSSLFAYGAMTAAESAGVPFDVLMSNVYVLPAPGMPAFGFGALPAKGVMGRARDRAVNSVVARQWNKGLAPVNELRTSMGLEPLESFFDQVHRARAELVLSSRDFDFPAELGSNVRYVGPVLDDPGWAREGTWTPPPGDEPLVLVAMSSTFQDQGASLQRVVDALAPLPVRGLVTTGPALDPSVLEAPDNVTVVAAAPHSEVLRHAAAVVTHGGHGTVVRALAAGVPMAVMPHGRDQADNAARVTARGAGVRIGRRTSAGRIAAAVRRLLEDPSYRSAAERLGRSIVRDAASGDLVSALEDVPAAPAPSPGDPVHGARDGASSAPGSVPEPETGSARGRVP